MHHHIIETFSREWFMANILICMTITILIVSGASINKLRDQIAAVSGMFFIAIALMIHPYLFYIGSWSLKHNLPLQICSLSGWLSGIVLLWRNQSAYEFLLYWGLAGATHSLLTPEITQGDTKILYYEYFVSHGGIIFSALYLSIVYKMRPRRKSWWNVYLLTQLLVPVVAIVNWSFNANYMFLCQKPSAANPFVIGEWPWYLIGLEIAMLLHFLAIYALFYFSKTKVVNYNHSSTII